jgi:hypothetical protein
MIAYIPNIFAIEINILFYQSTIENYRDIIYVSENYKIKILNKKF